MGCSSLGCDSDVFAADGANDGKGGGSSNATVKKHCCRHQEVSERCCRPLLSGINQDLSSEDTKRLLGGALPLSTVKSKTKLTPTPTPTPTPTSTPTPKEQQEDEQGTT